ncbi:MAG: ATP-binding protein [Bacteroidales bacterium]|nr:ATP-binding protein [Bacteroidales bacterium]MBR5780455.1 ATP-binding protein [Bacteroidales bacterium]
MVDKRIIEQVLSEQYEELLLLRDVELCTRKEESQVEMDSNMAQVVIGVRRSGKSTLCYNVLKSSNEKFAYVNFDDERFENLQTSDLNTVLEILYKIYGDFKYLFLDEIQNIDGWHLFVNRLLRQRMHIIVTGSNAKLLSGELATHLTGRNDLIELFPFSFAEWCQCKNVDVKSMTTKAEASRRAAFDEYLKQGGFPELVYKENKTRYVGNLVNNIIKRDIEQRHNIKYVEAFEQLAHHIMNIAPVTIVESELASVIGLKSNHTINNYINFLKEAYLLLGVKRFSNKSRQRVRAEKVYPVDVSLMDSRPDAFAGDNVGWRLETIVYIELLRRNRPINRDVYYYKSTAGYEADFVVCRNNVVEEIYQVSYDISKDKTRKRELRGLLTASKETRCENLYLITDYHQEETTIENKTIHIIPAYHWLLN